MARHRVAVIICIFVRTKPHMGSRIAATGTITAISGTCLYGIKTSVRYSRDFIISASSPFTGNVPYHVTIWLILRRIPLELLRRYLIVVLIEA